MSLTGHCATFLILIAVTPAIAGLVGQSPFSWSAVSVNGEYIYVGLSPVPLDDQIRLTEEGGATKQELYKFERKIRELHRRYASSGMYRIDKPNSVLWKTPAWEGFGYPSNDGSKLGVIGPGINETSSETHILRVYDASGLIRVIYEDQVMTGLEQILSRLVLGHRIDIDTGTVTLNQQRNGYSFETTLGERFEVSFFDEPSLRLISTRSPILTSIIRGFWTWATLLTALLGGVATFFCCRRKAIPCAEQFSSQRDE